MFVLLQAEAYGKSRIHDESIIAFNFAFDALFFNLSFIRSTLSNAPIPPALKF